MSDNVQITLEWTVEQTLQDKPGTARVFIKHQTQCVGCWMQKFCTIKDVAETYGLDLNILLQNLHQSTFDSPARQPDKEHTWKYLPISGDTSSKPLG